MGDDLRDADGPAGSGLVDVVPAHDDGVGGGRDHMTAFDGAVVCQRQDEPRLDHAARALVARAADVETDKGHPGELLGAGVDASDDAQLVPLLRRLALCLTGVLRESGLDQLVGGVSTRRARGDEARSNRYAHAEHAQPRRG